MSIAFRHITFSTQCLVSGLSTPNFLPRATSNLTSLPLVDPFADTSRPQALDDNPFADTSDPTNPFSNPSANASAFSLESETTPQTTPRQAQFGQQASSAFGRQAEPLDPREEELRRRDEEMTRRQRELDERERRMDAGEGKANWPFCELERGGGGPKRAFWIYHRLT